MTALQGLVYTDCQALYVPYITLKCGEADTLRDSSEKISENTSLDTVHVRQLQKQPYTCYYQNSVPY